MKQKSHAMKTSPRKLTCGIVAAIILLLVIATIGGSFYMLDYSLSPDPNRQANNRNSWNRYYKELPEMRPWMDSLRQHHALRDTFIKMASGERHHAYYMRAHSFTPKTALLVHGYHDSALEMIHIGWLYHHLLGYNILLPDLHAHGSSEGDDVQMGWKDRLDVLQWAKVADRLFRGPTPHTRMVVHGVSMGAATTMCLSGENTPGYIRAFVEDCGYTSVWDEFDYELKDQFGLPSFPLMWTTSALCKLKYGWSFGEASPLRQVAKCNKPMLFIHGTADTYVPTRMVHPLYEAKSAPKSISLMPGAIHARSFQHNTSEYIRQVKSFCQKNI